MGSGLNFLGASLLYLLWKRRRSGDGALVAAKTLHQELVAGAAGSTFRETLPVNAVKKELARLQHAGMLNGVVMSKENADPGPAPKGYRFSADAPIITQRPTATMIMKLHNHPEQRVATKHFVQEILALRLGHDDAREPLTPQDIEDQIAYCVKKGYIEEVETEDEGAAPAIQQRLCTTNKVDEYRMFLEKLAAEAKILARNEPALGDALQNKPLRTG